MAADKTIATAIKDVQAELEKCEDNSREQGILQTALSRLQEAAGAVERVNETPEEGEDG